MKLPPGHNENAVPPPLLRHRLQSTLVAWFCAGHRQLPWRDDPSPYRVWVSEIMLQQTQVVTVIPYFERFIERFPTVFSLAEAPLDDVLALWSGLGYYSRARNLHRAAKLIVEIHRGELPADPGMLLNLPGVGRYTAGAIGSIAFGHPVPLVDGNVIRVLTRVFDCADDVGQSATQTLLWQIAAVLVPSGEASVFNQGMMELGALVCTPKTPRCADCPWNTECLAYQRGSWRQRPVKAKKAKPKRQELVSVIFEHPSRGVWLVRRPESGLFGGLWEMPTRECIDIFDVPPQEVAEKMIEQMGSKSAETGLKFVGNVRHTLTHRQLLLHVFYAEWHYTIDPAVDSFYTDGRWVSGNGELRSLGIGTLMRKVLRLGNRHETASIQQILPLRKSNA